jgi:hypothetical protein
LSALESFPSRFVCSVALLMENMDRPNGKIAGEEKALRTSILIAVT